MLLKKSHLSSCIYSFASSLFPTQSSYHSTPQVRPGCSRSHPPVASYHMGIEPRSSPAPSRHCRSAQLPYHLPLSSLLARLQPHLAFWVPPLKSSPASCLWTCCSLCVNAVPQGVHTASPSLHSSVCTDVSPSERPDCPYLCIFQLLIFILIYNIYPYLILQCIFMFTFEIVFSLIRTKTP